MLKHRRAVWQDREFSVLCLLARREFEVSEEGAGANGVVYHERVVRQKVREFEAGTFFQFF